MAKVITLRLKEKELGFIESLSKKDNEDKSSAARKLIDYGWIYFIIKNYREGKIRSQSLNKNLIFTFLWQNHF